LRCTISAITISNRIDSLIDSFHKTSDIDVFSEANKLHKLREYLYKNGSIKWKVYFFRRSRYRSHRISIRNKIRDLLKLKRKL
jgi:hypothetical protein